MKILVAFQSPSNRVKCSDTSEWSQAGEQIRGFNPLVIGSSVLIGVVA